MEPSVPRELAALVGEAAARRGHDIILRDNDLGECRADIVACLKPVWSTQLPTHAFIAAERLADRCMRSVTTRHGVELRFVVELLRQGEQDLLGDEVEPGNKRLQVRIYPASSPAAG